MYIFLPSFLKQRELSFRANSPDENIYFVCKVTNDATPININSVIDFYEKMYNGKDFIEDMRVYAKEHLLWKKILRPVIEYLN